VGGTKDKKQASKQDWDIIGQYGGVVFHNFCHILSKYGLIGKFSTKVIHSKSPSLYLDLSVIISITLTALS
jgi:hypothetical protein